MTYIIILLSSKIHLFDNLIYYFAYGANISEEVMKRREVEYLHKYHGILNDYELKFNKLSKTKNHTFANVSYKEGKHVEGAVYVIRTHDIAKLDKAEGVNTSPPHYFKNNLNVSVRLGDIWHTIECFVYTANNQMINNELKPLPQYVDLILEMSNKFSEKYVQEVKYKGGLLS